MKLPLIFRRFGAYRSIPKYIVIHGTKCVTSTDPLLNNDIKNRLQIPRLKQHLIIENKMEEIPFHFVVKKMFDDYEVYTEYPLHCPIHYYDNIKHNEKIIHVGIFGQFNSDIATPRLYEVLVYRILSPLMFWFRIDQNRIFLHSDIDKEAPDCPGIMFYKEILLQKLMKYLKRK